MKKYIIIEADTNDGDYVTKKTILKEEHLETLKKVCKVLEKDSGYGTSEMLEDDNDPERFVESKELTKEDLHIFDNYCPSGEYGIHTIESVEILTVLEEEKLL